MGLSNSKEDFEYLFNGKTFILTTPKDNNEYLLFLDFLRKTYNYDIYESESLKFNFIKKKLNSQTNILNFMKNYDDGILLLREKEINNLVKFFGHPDFINKGDIIIFRFQNKLKIDYLRLG